MHRAGRRKRDSVGNIYHHCSRFNTCPQDVKNKVERTTTADKILQYGTAVTFLGNLAISSSAGTAGGLAADAILGEAAAVGAAREGLLRPALPPDTVGPLEVPATRLSEPIIQGQRASFAEHIPLQVLNTHEVSPETVVTFLEDTTVSDVPSIGPRVEIPGEDTAAIVEVPRNVPGRAVVSRTQYSNPAFEVSVHSNIKGAETSAPDNVFVDSVGSSGHTVGEDIPLLIMRSEPTFDDTFIADTEIDTEFLGPRTSTPRKPAVQRPASGPGSRGPQRKGILKRLFHRNTEQIPVMEDIFITSPKRLVTFENPAFEESASLIFERDLMEIERAPHSAFRDIVRLGRIHLTEGPGRRVKVSRLGKKATIRTRSGVQIGPEVHYYKDLSSIGHEAIEMQVLGEVSGTAEVADALAVSPINDDIPVRDIPVTVTDVYEPEADPTHTIHVNFGSQHDYPGIPVSDYVLPPRETTVIVDTEEGVVIDIPESPLQPAIVPEDIPEVLIEVLGSSGDYYLHPSLLRRRKRRRLM